MAGFFTRLEEGGYWFGLSAESTRANAQLHQATKTRENSNISVSLKINCIIYIKNQK